MDTLMFSTLTQENVSLVGTYELHDKPSKTCKASKENNMAIAFIMLLVILAPIYIHVFMED